MSDKQTPRPAASKLSVFDVPREQVALWHVGGVAAEIAEHGRVIDLRRSKKKK